MALDTAPGGSAAIFQSTLTTDLKTIRPAGRSPAIKEDPSGRKNDARHRKLINLRGTVNRMDADKAFCWHRVFELVST